LKAFKLSIDYNSICTRWLT